ncbi:MAG: type II toxin-antitoxin system YoeB family toxin [Oscillospiraceae bacterium]|nr:type II toxin-antitoxin system YoeB family toxin [Oscillospiraceae bacterium]
MKLIWDEKAWEEYEYWQGQDKKTLKKMPSISFLAVGIIRISCYSNSA